jgi:hypothetical protein
MYLRRAGKDGYKIIFLTDPLLHKRSGRGRTAPSGVSLPWRPQAPVTPDPLQHNPCLRSKTHLSCPHPSPSPPDPLHHNPSNTPQRRRPVCASLGKRRLPAACLHLILYSIAKISLNDAQFGQAFPGLFSSAMTAWGKKNNCEKIN